MKWAAFKKKETFEIIDKNSIDLSNILLLMWVFNYKFDLNRFLAQFKAQICV